jgi:hypothetical protein
MAVRLASRDIMGVSLHIAIALLSCEVLLAVRLASCDTGGLRFVAHRNRALVLRGLVGSEISVT